MRAGSSASLSKVLKPGVRHFAVARRVLDVAVTEISLPRASTDAVIPEFITAGVPQLPLATLRLET